MDAVSSAELAGIRAESSYKGTEVGNKDEDNPFQDL